MSSVFVGLIAVTLILIGNVNSLAPVVTMPFLMTYAAINYAYFKLVMCVDLQNRKKLVEHGVLVEPAAKEAQGEDAKLVSKPKMMDSLLTKDYGSNGQRQPADDVTLMDEYEKSDGCEKENLEKDLLEGNERVTEMSGITGDDDDVNSNVPATAEDVMKLSGEVISDQKKLLNKDDESGREIKERKTGMNVFFSY